MNREILFRGKRVANGKWLYGDLLQGKCGDTTYAYIRSETVLRVDPSTVGQFTGLRDEDETPIFEGDIMWGSVGMSIPSYFEPPDSEYYKGEVRYEGGGFVFFVPDAHERGQNISYSLSEVYNNNDVKVIGSVHDNPELLNA